MGRIVGTEFVSLDGAIQAPGGGEDFQRGGRTLQVDQGADGANFKPEEALDAEALVGPTGWPTGLSRSSRGCAPAGRAGGQPSPGRGRAPPADLSVR
jgi:hypothetical protein